MLTMSDLKSFIGDIGELSQLVIASEIMTSRVVIVRPDDHFETAFEIFEGKQISTLPVVANDGSLLGILKKSDLLLAYNQKILKLNVTQRG